MRNLFIFSFYYYYYYLFLEIYLFLYLLLVNILSLRSRCIIICDNFEFWRPIMTVHPNKSFHAFAIQSKVRIACESTSMSLLNIPETFNERSRRGRLQYHWRKSLESSVLVWKSKSRYATVRNETHSEPATGVFVERVQLRGRCRRRNSPVKVLPGQDDWCRGRSSSLRTNLPFTSSLASNSSVLSG